MFKLKLVNKITDRLSMPDFGVSTFIMISRRYLAQVVQVELWTLAWEQ